jgi:predicted dehydrogenase
MAEYAAALGCHLLCDKPLGLNEPQGRAMLHAVEKAGVKHAYAANSLYNPLCLYARDLITGGLLGQVREIECVLHMETPDATPYSWLHSLELGGGMLNTILTHKLGQVCSITNSQVIAATGATSCLIERAPVGEYFHDFRQYFDATLQPDEQTEWRAVDADLAYTVITQLRMADGGVVNALFQASVMATGRNANYLAFYGEQGTLHLPGAVGPTSMEHYDIRTGKWQELHAPASITQALPQVEDGVQRDWNQLVRQLVADIQGEGDATYPTFRDGWIHNQVIDAARAGHGWIPIHSQLVGLL